MNRKAADFVIAGVSFGTGFFLGGKMLVGMINDYKTRMNRNLFNMLLLNDWLDFIYSGGNVERYFLEHGYHRIMIYGNGYIGARLIQALAGTNVDIAAVMDRTASSGRNGMVIGTDADIPDADCIVITPIYYYESIYHMLKERTQIPIVSVQEVVRRSEKNGPNLTAVPEGPGEAG